jgi:3-oxoacyl-(acyl-carrier-protein) synthase
MAVNTPLGDNLQGFLAALLAGRSAITRWKAFETAGIYSKVGGDLSDYDVDAKVAALESRLPADVHRRLRRLSTRVAWSTRLSTLAAADAWLDASLDEAPLDPMRVGVIVAGHNLSSNYVQANMAEFRSEPDYIDPFFALHSLGTDHAGCVSEVLEARGPIYTVGAECASGNTALRCAVDEIRYHDLDAVVVVGAALEFAPIDLHGMALMGAISVESFNDDPAAASRPYDTRREGFIPAHGTAAMIVEALDAATARGARVHAEVMGVEASADGSHLPQPHQDGQVAAMTRTLEQSGVAAEEIDFISAHATSTPVGDITELRSIKQVFGKQAARLRINAPKSMLGHTCWAAPTVESVAAILQMNAGRLHPSINIDTLDPEADLDICRTSVPCDIRCIMKNAFGFGGINCVAIFRRYEGQGR